jgi:hypothetical protein
MTGSHLPVDYRGRFEHEESRFGPPGDICDTCSDFERGQLVPISFCERAGAAFEEYHNWLYGDGTRPIWLDTPDAMVEEF